MTMANAAYCIITLLLYTALLYLSAKALIWIFDYCTKHYIETFDHLHEVNHGRKKNLFIFD